MTRCWWCTYDTAQNLSMPIKYCHKTKHFKCLGTFCSWECMKAYNYYDNNNYKHIRSSYILKMYQSFNANKSKHINTAPKRELLDVFGGPLTREQFIDKKHTYNIIPHMIIEETLNIDKHINYRWVTKNNAKEQYDSANSKNNINPLKIKCEQKPKNTNTNSNGIFSFSSFIK